jgi:IS5 family transposase
MATDDFFRARFDGMVDLRHSLAVLASRMQWSGIEAALAPAFAHKNRKGRAVEGADMFGPTLSVAAVVERWSENVVWQFFSGMEYYSPKLPCDPAQISRFRKILGEAGVEQLLKTIIEAAVAMKAVKKTESAAGSPAGMPMSSRAASATSCS